MIALLVVMLAVILVLSIGWRQDNKRKSETIQELVLQRESHVCPFHVHRRELSDDCESLTHKFSVGGCEGWITVRKFKDGKPGSVYVNLPGSGSRFAGLMDSLASMTSIALQHGVPLQFLAERFTLAQFEPAGVTKNPRIPSAKSLVDYMFKWLACHFLPREEWQKLGVLDPPPPDQELLDKVRKANACPDCEAQMETDRERGGKKCPECHSYIGV